MIVTHRRYWRQPTEEPVRDTTPNTLCQADDTVQDIPMSEDLSYHVSPNPYLRTLTRLTSTQPESSSIAEQATAGCGYLQALLTQIEHYPTTGGEYLEAIFTHREAFYNHPPGHRSCARGFSDIAYAVEQRAWRADREADAEAAVAFRHEAWVIAASL